MMSRRSLVLGAAGTALGAGRPHPGTQTNAWTIDPKDFGTFIKVLATVKRLGFEGFETSFRNVQERFGSTETAREEIKKTGLRFFGVHIFLLEYDQETAIAPWELIERVVNGGAALGAERLILSGKSTPDGAVLARKAKALGRAGKYCRDKGLKFGYHNHDAEFRENGRQIEALLAQTDPELFHLILDAGHAQEGGANVAEFFAKHAARIDGIHLRDAKQGNEVPLGQGDYDWKPLAAAVAHAKWDGWVLTEEERLSGEKPGEAAVKPAREAIRRLFGV
jgi:sugar phosphate isomerase/epimerase